MSINVSDIAANIHQVQQRIAEAGEQSGRQPGDVALLAVSKTKPVEALRAAYQAGQRRFGENYLQESLDKMDRLQDLDIEWHFIGPLQSNKTRNVAERFDWVHTIDRDKIARRLNDQRPANLPPLNVCLQVNIDDEASKSGVAPEQLGKLTEAVIAMPRLRLRGLMAIPAPSEHIDQQRQSFARVAQLQRELREAYPNYDGFDTLSMGMSRDMAAAIAEGATMVRIGTDIFGQRDYTNTSNSNKDTA
ncbi:YggS family pyridoxal phosphate-dependent enzyme [Porticoccaceae bacterium LTM1]|nr:YggS family pyridoxal phosphate-dependent enzyme [Porticoccaceae bacterium LTM1]